MSVKENSVARKERSAAAVVSADSDPDEPLPQKALWCAYAAGLSTNAIAMMLKVAVPLWALHLDMPLSQIGLAIGAGGVLPFLFSIHGGILMDRFGTRRVNVTLAALATIVIVLFPILPFASAVIALQLLSGLCMNMGWMGAQTLIVQIAPGNTAVIGRFSVASHLGNLVSPVLTGLLWDTVGPWGTFTMIAAGSFAAWIAFYAAPPSKAHAGSERSKVSLGGILPRWSEYRDSFAMMAIPAVAFICVITFVRIAGSAMQASFYVVYLENIDVSGTIIGVLIGVAEGCGMFGASIAGWVEAKLKPHWTLILFHAGAVLAVAITPFLGGLLPLLFLAATMRGTTQGLSQPVMFSVLSRAVSPTEQGRSIGLRSTINRLATIVVPPIMGVIAQAVDLQASFAVVGGSLILLCAGLALVVRRVPAFNAP